MATTPYDDSPPTISERYEIATGTSNLRCLGGDADRGGAVNVVMSAGSVQQEKRKDKRGEVHLVQVASPTRTGMALLRLASEWDRAAKPRQASPQAVKALALTMPDAKGRPDIMRARREAAAWYANELKLLSLQLRSRAGVLVELNAWANPRGIDGDAVMAALHWWLDHTCEVCDGHGLRKEPDAPSLSARQCGKCNGTGEKHTPTAYGATAVIDQIGYALLLARQSLKRRLRP
jgi:hypothetical protein